MDGSDPGLDDYFKDQDTDSDRVKKSPTPVKNYEKSAPSVGQKSSGK